MSKYKNSPNSKETIEAKLKEVGLTVAEVKKWLETGDLEDTVKEKEDSSQTLFGFMQSPSNNRSSSGGCDEKSCKVENKKTSNFADFFDYLQSSHVEEQEYETCEVSFLPGNNTEETAVYVGEYKLDGVVRSSLEYDPEMYVPVLHLEILNPRIL